MSNTLLLLHFFVQQVFGEDTTTIQYYFDEFRVVLRSIVTADDIRIEAKHDKSADEDFDDGIQSLVAKVTWNSSAKIGLENVVCTVHTAYAFVHDFFERMGFCKCDAGNPILSDLRYTKTQCSCKSLWTLFEAFDKRFQMCPIKLESTDFEVSIDSFGKPHYEGCFRRHIFKSDQEIFLKNLMHDTRVRKKII